jgi:pyruvate carboxylase
MGIRLDGSMGYVGARISPHYDSLLVKVTASGVTWESTIRRMRMALSEMRVKGVVTNTGFLMNLLDHPSFREQGYSWTTFIDDTPSLFTYSRPKNTEIIEILHYLGELAVFGKAISPACPHSFFS